MNHAQLLTHFDRINETPDAISRLRHFILDLAVRGKLVEHEKPSEGWIDDLMRDKQSVLRELGIRRHPETKTPLDSEFVFEVPQQWARLQLADLLLSCKTDYGDDPGPNLVNVAVVKVGNINNQGRFARGFGLRGFSEQELDGLLARQNDFIIVKSSGSAENVHSGKAALCDAEHDGKLIASNFTLRLRLFSHQVVPQFVWRLLNSPVCRDWVAAAVQTMTYPNLTWSDYAAMPVGLPPLAEQHRIVAKVDELMALCDRLEAAQAERESRRDRLVTSSLSQLNNGEDPDAFRNHARFTLDNLARLTTRQVHIQQLRQSILNLAVRGKLAAQDPNDEPASELLERVAGQKTKAGNAKTGRDWVGDIAKPVDEAFVIPKGWAWTRIANTVERVTVGYVGPMKNQYVQDGIPFLRSQNVRANRFRVDGLISISPKFHQAISKSALAPGDVVVVRSGNVGTACVIPPSLLKANCSDLVVVKHPIAVHPAYLCFYLNSLASTHIEAGTVGVALTHFNTKSVATMPFPLPPLPEQHRIVAKVDELMGLCDRLEMQLATTQTESRRLLEAVLHEALAPV